MCGPSEPTALSSRPSSTLNLDLFHGFEESTLDMYSSVRHAYLQRRERLCRE